jgi:hypothetical protein
MKTRKTGHLPMVFHFCWHKIAQNVEVQQALRDLMKRKVPQVCQALILFETYLRKREA